MFKIITDPEEAAAFQREGLLWWVSRADGGNPNYNLRTIPFRGYSTDDAGERAKHGYLGVLVDE